MSFSLDMSTRLAFAYTKTVGTIPGSFAPIFARRLSLTDGTGVNQASVLYFNQLVIAGSGTTSLDFVAGAADAYGATITMAKIKGIYVANLNTVAGDTVTVGDDANPIPGPSNLVVGPNGLFILSDPSLAGLGTTTAGTGDILLLTNNSANPVTIDIAVWGV